MQENSVTTVRRLYIALSGKQPAHIESFLDHRRTELLALCERIIVMHHGNE